MYIYNMYIYIYIYVFLLDLSNKTNSGVESTVSKHVGWMGKNWPIVNSLHDEFNNDNSLESNYFNTIFDNPVFYW